MDMDIQRIGVITGASRGIGAAIARELAERGYELVINARDEAALGRKASELESLGAWVRAVPGDISLPETSERMFAVVEKRLSELGDGAEPVLINNAGISHLGLIQDMSVEQWQRLIGVNLGGMFYTVRKAVPLMLSRKSGHIVNISSVWGQVGASMEAAYSASKGGVDAFTRALAKELAPSGICVNALSLGAMDTSMNDCFSPEEKQAIAEDIPAGRFGDPKEAARICAELCQCSHYLTGQIIRLDGAWI